MRSARPSTAATPRTRAASSITFCPDAATRCESPEARNSLRVRSGSAASSPRAMPRSRAPSGGGTPVRRTAWARARTPSTTPASPPRLAPVSDSASARSWACTPRARCQASDSGQVLEPASDGEHRADALGRPAHATARRAAARARHRASPWPPARRTSAPAAPRGARRARARRARCAAPVGSHRSPPGAPARRGRRRRRRPRARGALRRASRAPAPRARRAARPVARAVPGAGRRRAPRSPRATAASAAPQGPRRHAPRQSGARRTRVSRRRSAAAAPLTAGPCPSGRPGASGRCPGSRRGRRSSESRRAAGGTRGSCWRWPGRRRRACRAARPSRC